MSGLSTMLAERVESLLPRAESLLPHAEAAACISPRNYCSSFCDKINGSCLWLHRYCNLSCFGRTHTCGSWHDGRC